MSTHEVIIQASITIPKWTQLYSNNNSNNNSNSYYSEFNRYPMYLTGGKLADRLHEKRNPPRFTTISFSTVRNFYNAVGLRPLPF